MARWVDLTSSTAVATLTPFTSTCLSKIMHGPVESYNLEWRFFSDWITNILFGIRCYVYSFNKRVLGLKQKEGMNSNA